MTNAESRRAPSPLRDELTIEETAKQMREYLAETGHLKPEDADRVLGDPRVGVGGTIPSNAYGLSTLLPLKRT